MPNDNPEKNDDSAKYKASPHVGHNGSKITGVGGTVSRETEGSSAKVGGHYHGPSGTTTMWVSAKKKVADNTDVNCNGQVSTNGAFKFSAGFGFDY